MLKWSIEKVDNFNLIIKVEGGGEQGIGEVTVDRDLGETAEGIEYSFSHFESLQKGHVDGLEFLTGLLEGSGIPQGLRFGIESAYIHYLSAVNDISIQQILCLNQVKSVPITFSLPLMSAKDFLSFYKENDLIRFDSLKITMDGKSSIPLVEKVASIHGGSIHLDLGHSFQNPDDVVDMLEGFCGVAIKSVERPMVLQEYGLSRKLSESVGIPIFTDMLIGSGAVTKEFRECFGGVHIKLMKSGGYIRALNQIRMAKDANMKVLLSSPGGTSPGVFSALNIAEKADYFNLESLLFLKNDGYNLVREENGCIFYSFLH